MRHRTLILRIWRDAAGGLTVQLSDPLSEIHARFARADELWAALEQCSSSAERSQPHRELEGKQDEKQP